MQIQRLMSRVYRSTYATHDLPHYIPYIYSAFSGLTATHTHYIIYIYSTFSGLAET